MPRIALLLDRGRLGVALNHHQAAQHCAIFARHFLPRILALVHAEIDFAAFHLRCEEHAPAVFGHSDIIELGPALRIDADRGAQIDKRFLEALGPHVVPPVEITGVPLLQCAFHTHVLPERHVVGDQAVIIDLSNIHGSTLS